MLAAAVCASSAAAETMSIVDPVTDNYKASFNADPSVRELRTWFSIRAISAAGTTWAPTEPGEIQIVEGGTVAVHGADGRDASLTARTVSGPFGGQPFRVDPFEAESKGRWGMLATVTDPATLQTTPAVVALTLVVGGNAVATGTVQYRYDAALANVGSGNIEYNGPGGRWWVGGVATRTNWEPAPASPPTLVASTAAAQPEASPPRVVGITLPFVTAKRLVTLRVRGRAGNGGRISLVRVRIDGRSWGRWIRVRASYSLTLPRGTATHAVRVQLRDTAGRASAVAVRRIRCTCG
ncbi:MAG: hypothetical protein JWM98_1564 [Thermoleophilia bacterium]|nr:hypothetical protein [Thermoleophilia bacterium]